jgi:E3 ubiquitin-protein ligase RNF216
MDDNVIEVSSSSSSEPSPRKAANAKAPKSKRLSRNVGRFNNDLVIELTDSEPEESDAFALKKRSSGKISINAAPVAGPSRPRPRPIPSQSFAVSPHASTSALSRSPKASTSATPKPPTPRKTPSGSVPLFLPDDEGENDFAQPNVEPPAGPANFANGQPAMDAVLPAPPEPTSPVPPPPEANPIDAYVAKVLEIIPDVEVDHLLGLIMQHLPSSKEQVVETVLYILFDNPTYPKVERKGKRKREEDMATASGSKSGVDYANKERDFKGSPQYVDLALVSLFKPTPRDFRSFLESRNISF